MPPQLTEEEVNEAIAKLDHATWKAGAKVAQHADRGLSVKEAVATMAAAAAWRR